MKPRYDAEAFFNSTSFELAGHLAWSADDTHVLISSDETGIFNVHVLNVETGAQTPLTRSSGDSCFAISGFPSDDRILYTADQGGNEINHLYVRETSGEVKDLTPGEQVKAMFAGWSKDYAHFFVATNARDPKAFDLYRYRADNYASELIFQNDGGFSIARLDDERYIAILKAHSSANAAVFLVDRQANEASPRLTNRTSLPRRWCATRAMISWISPASCTNRLMPAQRIPVRRWFMFMAGAALAFRPAVFKAGINIFGVMNWVRTLKSIPAWWGEMRDRLYDLMGDPATDEERLTRISPLFHADNIRAPLLVVQGANDPRVLQAESDEIVAAVRENGVPVEYVLFDDEGHGFTKRANRIKASNAFVEFLNRYL